jgi:hypothetical protein
MVKIVISNNLNIPGQVPHPGHTFDIMLVYPPELISYFVVMQEINNKLSG